MTDLDEEARIAIEGHGTYERKFEVEVPGAEDAA